MNNKEQVFIERESIWILHKSFPGFFDRVFVCIFTDDGVYQYVKTSAFSVDQLKLLLVTL